MNGQTRVRRSFSAPEISANGIHRRLKDTSVGESDSEGVSSEGRVSGLFSGQDEKVSETSSLRSLSPSGRERPSSEGLRKMEIFLSPSELERHEMLNFKKSILQDIIKIEGADKQAKFRQVIIERVYAPAETSRADGYELLCFEESTEEVIRELCVQSESQKFEFIQWVCDLDPKNYEIEQKIVDQCILFIRVKLDFLTRLNYCIQNSDINNIQENCKECIEKFLIILTGDSNNPDLNSYLVSRFKEWVADNRTILENPVAKSPFLIETSEAKDHKRKSDKESESKIEKSRPSKDDCFIQYERAASLIKVIFAMLNTNQEKQDLQHVLLQQIENARGFPISWGKSIKPTSDSVTPLPKDEDMVVPDTLNAHDKMIKEISNLLKGISVNPSLMTDLERTVEALLLDRKPKNQDSAKVSHFFKEHIVKFVESKINTEDRKFDIRSLQNKLQTGIRLNDDDKELIGKLKDVFKKSGFIEALKKKLKTIMIVINWEQYCANGKPWVLSVPIDYTQIKTEVDAKTAGMDWEFFNLLNNPEIIKSIKKICTPTNINLKHIDQLFGLDITSTLGGFGNPDTSAIEDLRSRLESAITIDFLGAGNARLVKEYQHAGKDDALTGKHADDRRSSDVEGGGLLLVERSETPILKLRELNLPDLNSISFGSSSSSVPMELLPLTRLTSLKPLLTDGVKSSRSEEKPCLSDGVPSRTRRLRTDLPTSYGVRKPIGSNLNTTRNAQGEATTLTGVQKVGLTVQAKHEQNIQILEGVLEELPKIIAKYTPAEGLDAAPEFISFVEELKEVSEFLEEIIRLPKEGANNSPKMLQAESLLALVLDEVCIKAQAGDMEGMKGLMYATKNFAKSILNMRNGLSGGAANQPESKHKQEGSRSDSFADNILELLQGDIHAELCAKIRKLEQEMKELKSQGIRRDEYRNKGVSSIYDSEGYGDTSIFSDTDLNFGNRSAADLIPDLDRTRTNITTYPPVPLRASGLSNPVLVSTSGSKSPSNSASSSQVEDDDFRDDDFSGYDSDEVSFGNNEDFQSKYGYVEQFGIRIYEVSNPENAIYDYFAIDQTPDEFEISGISTLDNTYGLFEHLGLYSFILNDDQGQYVGDFLYYDRDLYQYRPDVGVGIYRSERGQNYMLYDNQLIPLAMEEDGGFTVANSASVDSSEQVKEKLASLNAANREIEGMFGVLFQKLASLSLEEEAFDDKKEKIKEKLYNKMSKMLLRKGEDAINLNVDLLWDNISKMAELAQAEVGEAIDSLDGQASEKQKEVDEAKEMLKAMIEKMRETQGQIGHANSKVVDEKAQERAAMAKMRTTRVVPPPSWSRRDTKPGSITSGAGNKTKERSDKDKKIEELQQQIQEQEKRQIQTELKIQELTRMIMMQHNPTSSDQGLGLAGSRTQSQRKSSMPRNGTRPNFHKPSEKKEDSTPQDRYTHLVTNLTLSAKGSSLPGDSPQSLTSLVSPGGSVTRSASTRRRQITEGIKTYEIKLLNSMEELESKCKSIKTVFNELIAKYENDSFSKELLLKRKKSFKEIIKNINQIKENPNIDANSLEGVSPNLCIIEWALTTINGGVEENQVSQVIDELTKNIRGLNTNMNMLLRDLTNESTKKIGHKSAADGSSGTQQKKDIEFFGLKSASTHNAGRSPQKLKTDEQKKGDSDKNSSHTRDKKEDTTRPTLSNRTVSGRGITYQNRVGKIEDMGFPTSPRGTLPQSIAVSGPKTQSLEEKKPDERR